MINIDTIFNQSKIARKQSRFRFDHLLAQTVFRLMYYYSFLFVRSNHCNHHHIYKWFTIILVVVNTHTHTHQHTYCFLTLNYWSNDRLIFSRSIAVMGGKIAHGIVLFVYRFNYIIHHVWWILLMLVFLHLDWHQIHMHTMMNSIISF